MDPLDPRRSALLTDLHEVATAAAYWEHGHNPRASFELSFRSLPPGFGYVVSAGLDQAVLYLQEVRFDEGQITWLSKLFAFHNVRPEFWDYLLAFRFSGELWAPPEGTPVFANEPMLRVTAPLVEAQLVGTYLSAVLSYESLVATATARIVEAAHGRPVVDYGTRRSHGGAAALLAARAAYIAGAAGTTLLHAGHMLGVPVHGTMPHALVMAFPGEEPAFEAWQALFPDSATFVLDTYDTRRAAVRLADLKLRMRAVRIDSGDLHALASEVRRTLDDAGLTEVKIVASGDLDETRIAALVAAGAAIDSFGVGAAIATPPAGNLGTVYKLVEIEGEAAPLPKLKIAAGKSTLPGRKQIWRRFGVDGRAKGDLIGLATETNPGAQVLQLVLKDGAWAVPHPGLETLRQYTQAALATVPPATRRLREPEAYPVTLSDELTQLRDRLTAAAAGPV